MLFSVYPLIFFLDLESVLLNIFFFIIQAETVLEAETVALLESINLAISNRWNNVLFETNCKTLVEALASSIVSYQ